MAPVRVRVGVRVRVRVRADQVGAVRRQLRVELGVRRVLEQHALVRVKGEVKGE